MKEIKFYMFAMKTVIYKLRHNPFYIKQYFMKVYYLLTYDYVFIKSKYKDIKMISNDETLNHIINKKKSIVRYGDGEIEMILGCSNYSGRYKEKYTKQLANYLESALKDFNNKKMIITIPYNRLIENYKGSIYWYFAQYNFYKYLSNEYEYGDAFIFRDLNKQQLDIFFKYLNTKDVLYISHEKNISIVKDRLNINNISYYETDANESFSGYTQLKKYCEIFINNKENPIILISSGKTSKVLAYELCDNVQVIDFGAFIESNKVYNKNEKNN